MTNAILFNGFTRVVLDGVALGEMQIGNPRGVYPIADEEAIHPEIEIAIGRLVNDAAIDAIFDGPETGYLARRGRFFYRNCNVANAMDWPEVSYRGRLPNARLRISLQTLDPLRIAVEVTPNFVRESRSRLSRIAPLDATISNLVLIAAILRGYMPMHAAAVELGSGAAQRSVLFMGLPNTGKTSTSLAIAQSLDGRYLAEDISFVRVDSGAVFGGPYTLDEQKLQDHSAPRAAQFTGAPAATLVMLQRSPGRPAARRLGRGDPAIADFIIEMNRYEFEWNHDLVLRHFMVGGARAGLNSGMLLQCWLDGMRRIAAGIDAVVLEGEDPGAWPALARTALAVAT